jgi:HK97 family phage major capsid protein
VSNLSIVAANHKARVELRSQIAEIDEKATKENRPYSDEESAQITEARSKLAAIDERIGANLEIALRSEQQADGMAHLAGVLADRESGSLIDTRSIGERFTSDEDYRSWAESGANGGFRREYEGFDLRSVSDTTTGSTSGGALTRPERIGRIGQDFLDRKVYLVDLLPHLNTNQGSIEYVQDKSPLADMANKAVEVTEGSAKPQAGITTAVITEPVRTIAAWANITRQVAADVPQVTSYLDGRLRYSLKRRTDLQIISGDGSAPNIKGLENRSGILTNAPGSAEDRAKTIRHSITVMEQAESVPEIIVLNPADAELFDLTNYASAGLHVFPDDGTGALQTGPSRSAWGLTQVHSTAIASGTALLIDPTAVAVVDRQQATAYMTDSHASNFTSNLLTLLLELRVGLALFNPAGVLMATFHD